jgi:hypothetical protein
MADQAIEDVAFSTSQPIQSKFDFSTVKNKAINNSVLAQGLKIFGEVALSPGTSLLLDGKLRSGIAHVGVGLIARRVFGLPGLLLVGANSYSQSVTGKSLLGHVQTFAGNKEETLGQRVKKAMDENKSLAEILETIAEDVEDKYFSHSSKA